jgi:two-component sensor histidine kinase
LEDGMSIECLPCAELAPNTLFEYPERRTVASYERELIRLREALAQGQALVREKDELIQQQAVLSQESDHRLLNGLQMIVSLISLQSQASANSEVAKNLAVAANRIAAVARIHRLLHSFGGVQTIPFKQYLEDICRDFAIMVSAQRSLEQIIVIEGIEIELPSATGIPLGFIVNELITNAVKYGKGRITVRLERDPGKGYVLSVSNDGPALPEGFDPAARKGLGLTIILALVEEIGGELRTGRTSRDTQFTVLFS